MGADTVTVIDATTNTVAATITDTVAMGNDPRFGVVTPDGASLYVSNNGSGDVTKINTSTLATSTIVTGGDPRNMAMLPAGSTGVGFVTDEDNGVVHVFSTATDTEVTGTGLPIDGFSTPRAIAAFGLPAPPPPTTTTSTTVAPSGNLPDSLPASPVSNDPNHVG